MVEAVGHGVFTLLGSSLSGANNERHSPLSERFLISYQISITHPFRSSTMRTFTYLFLFFFLCFRRFGRNSFADSSGVKYANQQKRADKLNLHLFCLSDLSFLLIRKRVRIPSLRLNAQDRLP